MRKITRVTLFIPKVKRNVAKVKRLIALKNRVCFKKCCYIAKISIQKSVSK